MELTRTQKGGETEMKKLGLSMLMILIFFIGAFDLGAQAKSDYSLNLIHVNDTHSHFDPATVKLTLDLDGSLKAKTVYVQMGGFPEVADVIGKLRAENTNSLVIHAGDFFQGTLYFTKYQGDADVAFWNLLGLDVATLGNHEFDKGIPLLKDHFLSKINFPIVSCNIDFSQEAALKGLGPAPYLIKVVGGQKMGFIGATTTDTPAISSPGPTIAFLDPVAPVQKAVNELHREGVDKIILISHLGYPEDLDLAGKVSGLSAIVGGHSHTLLGDWSAIGLHGMAPYPTLVKDKSGAQVLVLQSWEWAKVVGDIRLDFDRSGHVVAWTAKPVAVVGNTWFRIYDLPNLSGEPRRVQFVQSYAGLQIAEFDGKTYTPVADDLKAFYRRDFDKLEEVLSKSPEIALSDGDPRAAKLAAGYAAGVKQLQSQVATQAGEDLKRGLNTGPGPIIAGCMRLKTKTQIAITNAGGVRTDVLQGPLTVAQVYEIIPFGDTLVTMKLSGAQVIATLEDAVDFALANYGASFPENPLTYVSGIKFDVNPAAAKGGRVSGVQVLQSDGSYRPLDVAAIYSVCVNNFIAAGGDRYTTLKSGAEVIDTGFMDAEVLLDYAKDKILMNDQPSIRIVQ
jgi:5'-nucleotidase/UDP-sugar diphosphatase